MPGTQGAAGAELSVPWTPALLPQPFISSRPADRIRSSFFRPAASARWLLLSSLDTARGGIRKSNARQRAHCKNPSGLWLRPWKQDQQETWWLTNLGIFTFPFPRAFHSKQLPIQTITLQGSELNLLITILSVKHRAFLLDQWHVFILHYRRVDEFLQ